MVIVSYPLQKVPFIICVKRVRVTARHAIWHHDAKSFNALRTDVLSRSLHL